MPWLSIVPIAESRSSYNGLLVFVFITASALARRLGRSTASPRARCAALRPGTAAFPTRARPRNTPPTASPSRSAASSARRVRRAREAVEMPPPGDPRRPGSTVRDRATWSGTCSTRRSRAASWFTADRLNHLQFLTIRRYLSLVFLALVALLLRCSRYGRDPRPRRPGRADAAGAAAGAAAHRLRAQGEGAPAAPPRARRCSSPTATCCG